MYEPPDDVVHVQPYASEPPGSEPRRLLTRRRLIGLVLLVATAGGVLYLAIALLMQALS